MTGEGARFRVMTVSGSDKLHEYFESILPPEEFFPPRRAGSAAEARRELSAEPADILIVDAPLPDEFGVELCRSLADASMGILLLTKADVYEKVTAKVGGDGIFTLQKPNSRQSFYGAVRLLAALSVRLQKMERKNRSLQDKMTDIRAVNRAKWLLIEKLNMSEADAHRFIEKRAMDERIPRREIAEDIIRSYDN